MQAVQAQEYSIVFNSDGYAQLNGLLAKKNYSKFDRFIQCHHIFSDSFSIGSCKPLFFRQSILVENPPDALKSKDPR